MAKRARVWTGTEFVELASAQTDLTAYSTTAQMNTAIEASKGLTLINSTTVSAVSNVLINDVFTSTYQNYIILIRFTFSNSATVITGRFRANGSSNSTANYGDQSSYFNTALVASRTVGTGTSFIITPNLGASGVSLSLDFFNPQVATSTEVTLRGTTVSGSSVSIIGSGGFGLTNQFDGIEVISSLGNITGTIYVYGYKK